jgi:hypothetical protein
MTNAKMVITISDLCCICIMSPASIVPQHLQIVNKMSMPGLLQVFLAVSQIAKEAQTHHESGSG